LGRRRRDGGARDASGSMNIPIMHVAMLVAYATLMAMGNLVLEAAAVRLRAAQAETLLDIILAGLSNFYLWLGLGIYAFSFVLWLWLLSFIPLRYAYPVAATSLLIVPLLSGLMTREFPQPLYWIGIVLVIIGLTLVVTKLGAS
jgi:drug/metabolite transporter (DMT)-like permease